MGLKLGKKAPSDRTLLEGVGLLLESYVPAATATTALLLLLLLLLLYCCCCCY